MKELKEILNRSLIEDSSLSITVNCRIEKLNLKITDSRQMIVYGIGLDKQPGLTLNIEVNKNSKKGNRIMEVLNTNNLLTDFVVFEDKRSVIYLKDFGRKIDVITEAIQGLLDNFKKNNLGQPYQLTINRTDGNFRLD